MIHLRKNKVGDCRISGNVSRKTQLRMFISWALPAFCTIAAAGTPAYAVGVDAATASPKALTSSSSLLGADDDKSYKRLLQATETEVQTAATTEEVHEDHDHTEAEEEMGHDDHKDELIDIDHAEDDHDDHDEEDHSDHADDHHDDHGMTSLHDDHDDHDHHDEHLHGAETISAENKTVNSIWGAVIGATLLVNLATFSGVLILMVPAVQRGYLKYRGILGTPEAVTGKGGRMLDIFVPGFAVGALIATSVFLILPEALMYIGGGHDDHGDGHDDHSDHDGHRFLQDGHDDHDDDNEEGANAAKFGCSILGGFLLPLFFSILFHIPDEDVQTQAQGEKKVVEGDGVSPKADAETGVVIAAGGGDATSAEAPVMKPSVNKKLCATILLGDCFHNFSDGLFIAAAFRSCSQTLAIGIMLVTLAHEIPQELADFVILTQYAGLSVRKALLFNFVSGLSVLLGGIIFLASNPGAEATGVILAMGGGVYLNAAACETIPRMEPAMKIRWDRALMLFSIIMGAVPIGLILIDHKHCG